MNKTIRHAKKKKKKKYSVEFISGKGLLVWSSLNIHLSFTHLMLHFSKENYTQRHWQKITTTTNKQTTNQSQAKIKETQSERRNTSSLSGINLSCKLTLILLCKHKI